MNNEEIIIDDVDVSECEYCGYDNICKLKSASNYPVDCKDNPDCYYKQLKRKEQECEELKKELDFQKSMYECARADEEDKFEEIIELKQTLEEIREVLEFYANSKLGEQQEDGTYKILLNGGYIPIYCPKPAKKALERVIEVLNNDN